MEIGAMSSIPIATEMTAYGFFRYSLQQKGRSHGAPLKLGEAKLQG